MPLFFAILDNGQITSPIVNTTNSVITTLVTVPLLASTTTFVTVFVTARCTGGSAGTVDDSLGYVISGVFKLVGGVATPVGSSAPSTFRDKFLWSSSIVADSGNVLIQAKGLDNTNISWKAVYQIIKL